MLRHQKQEILLQLQALLYNTTMIVVSRHHGLSVEVTEAIRRHMREAKVQFRVTKNSLIRLALKDTIFVNLSPLFEQETAITVAQDPIMLSQVVVNCVKNIPQFQVLGGSLDQRVLLYEDIQELARTPTIEVLRTQILHQILTPATRLTSLLPKPPTQLIRILQEPSTRILRVLHTQEK